MHAAKSVYSGSLKITHQSTRQPWVVFTAARGHLSSRHICHLYFLLINRLLSASASASLLVSQHSFIQIPFEHFSSPHSENDVQIKSWIHFTSVWPLPFMLLFTSLLIKIDEQKEIHSAESHGAFIRIHSFRIPICFRAFINQAIIMMAAQN